jgi:hypothetical protein
VTGTGDVQAPRVTGTGDVQAPRVSGAGKNAGQSPSITSPAAKLVREAEAACKKGDMKTARAKAKAAIAQLKK